MALTNVPNYQLFSSLSTDSLVLLEKDANIGRVIVYYTDTQQRVTWNGTNWVDYSENGSFVLDDLGKPILKVANMAMAEQASHDELNCNSNLQINDLDVSPINPVPTTQSGSSATVLVKGTTNQDGLPILFIDTTKNFETSAFVNKTAKITISNIDYYRTITANTASGISINPIQLAVGASVTLGGAGSAVIRCKTLGVAGNANKIILAAGTGLGSLLGVTWDAGTTTLTITSPTDGGGSPTDIAAGNLEALFAGVPAVDALFSVDDDISAGALDLVASPGTSFTGGLDAINVPSGVEYEIIDYGISSVQLVAGTASVGTVSIVGNTLEEQLTEADDDPAGTLTFAQNISTIEISNTDTVNAGVFTVNGIAINVPVSTTVKFTVGGTPSNIVTLTGATTYIVNRYV